MVPAPDLAADQAGVFEHGDVARHGCERDRLMARDVGDAGFLLPHHHQDGAPGRVGECRVGLVQGG
jgi:hypothetical protein